MNLYQWNSPALADCDDGLILSFGEDEDDARQRAIDAVMKRYDTEGDYWQRMKKGLLRDLECAPEVVEDGTAFIRGSA